MRRADLREPLTLVLEGHLTEEALESALADAEARLVSEPRALIVDCTTMTGYERSAREFFVKWNRANKTRLTHVAIVTIKQVWRIVISAMSLASSQEMRAFDYMEDARRWIGDQSTDDAADLERFIDG